MAVKLARSLFPHCSLLDRQYSRNDATLLNACEGLSGDRIAAAEGWNRGKSFRSIDSTEAYGAIDDFSDYDVTLDYNGVVTKGKAADAMWKSLFADKKRPNFYYGSIKGINEKTVVVSGELYLAGDHDMGQSADVEMRWEKDGRSDQDRALQPYRVNFSPAAAFSSSSFEKLKPLPMRASCAFKPSTILAGPSLSAQCIGPPR